MAAEYLTRSSLDVLVGAARVDQLFDDDHDGLADPAKLDEILAQAEGLAASYLLRGFDADQITTLATNDPFFVSQVAWVAVELASESKGEFVGATGQGRYWSQYERAVNYFERLSKSQLHSKGEKTAGANKNSGGKLQPRRADGAGPRLVFAPDRDAPDGRGNF